MGISYDDFYELTLKEIKDTIKFDTKEAEGEYKLQQILAYTTAIMNAEAYHGKLRAYENYFPSSPSMADGDIKLKATMLNYANAVNKHREIKNI